MNILYKDDILKEVNKTILTGVTLIKNYTEQPTKTGSTYFGGNLEAKGELGFKVWRGSCFDKMNSEDYSGKICLVQAEINEYNGTKSLILKDISVVPNDILEKEDIRKGDFLQSKYDAEAYYATLYQTLQSHVTSEALQVFDLVMSDIKDKFIEEYAAVNYHDNCRNGLLAHTTKVVKMSTLIKMYPALLKRVSVDALYVGSALHDIGKVVEYDTGVISKLGKSLSHLTMGCIMISKYKDEIVALKGEDFYNTLLSIISQHHGEFGDQPRTIAAYVVHQLDMMDATFTLLNQKLEEGEDNTQISYNNMKLV